METWEEAGGEGCVHQPRTPGTPDAGRGRKDIPSLAWLGAQVAVDGVEAGSQRDLSALGLGALVLSVPSSVCPR